MLSNHTSFCISFRLWFHRFPLESSYTPMLALLESHTIIKVWSIAFNVHKLGLYKAPWWHTMHPSYSWEDYFNCSTPFATDGLGHSCISLSITWDLVKVPLIALTSSPMSLSLQHQSFITILASAWKDLGAVSSLNPNSCAGVTISSLWRAVRTSQAAELSCNEAGFHYSQRAD